MLSKFASLLLGAATLSSAFPVTGKRAVTALNEAAFEEAQPRDNTATRALSAVEIKTSTGKCLAVDELSGDFRANLTPIQVKDCDGSTGQLWDVITSGKHNNVAGDALIVSTLTQACFNFDPRRAPGNQVLLFSCGGRADGGGLVTDSQLFPLPSTSGPVTFAPANQKGATCFVIKGGVLDQAACASADATQKFTFGSNVPAAASTPPVASTAAAVTNIVAAPTVTVTATVIKSISVPTTIIKTVTVTAGNAVVTPPAAVITTPAPVTTSTPAATVPAAAKTVQAVSRAGGVLNPSAAAEANPVDVTAVKAFSAVPIKDSKGNCLSVDPTAGDFRLNLINPTLGPCTGAANELWDVITSGKHNNVANSTLLVSTVTEGCLNFDARRAAGDTVIMFSCGGRADGSGAVTGSQLFPFTGQKTLALTPENTPGTCFVNNNGKLDSAACSGGAAQLFTIG